MTTLKSKSFFFTIFFVFITSGLLGQTGTTQPHPPSNINQPSSGTHFNPFLISNLANLRWLSENSSFWGTQQQKYFFKQTADIDASETESWWNGQGFLPIGRVGVGAFSSIYDGDNYSISGLNLEATPYNPTGMFGLLNNATIINVKINDINISGTASFGFKQCSIGGLVGYALNSLIRWSSTTGIIDVYDTGAVGGLVGCSDRTEIYHCYSEATINVSNFSTSIFDEYSSAGGLVGELIFYSYIREAYFNGIITRNNDRVAVGGLVSFATEAEIRKVYVATKQPLPEGSFGIIEHADTWTILLDSYWDITATGMQKGVGWKFSTSIVEVSGLNTAQMKNEASFFSSQGWDFVNTWIIAPDINQGYPSFRDNVSLKPSNFYEHDSGSENNPFLISDLLNLRWLSESREYWGTLENTFYFIQTEDIEAIDTLHWNGGEGFTPIGIRRTSGNWIYFMGDYDGGGFKISNLNIKQRPQPYYDVYLGLFGYIYLSTIQNVRLENVYVSGSNANAALISHARNSKIINCSSSGFITGFPAPRVIFVHRGSFSLGGLIGIADYYSHIENTFSTTTLNGIGATDTGGLIGGLTNSTLKNSFFHGSIAYKESSDFYTAGGLVGAISESSNLHYSYVTSSTHFVNVTGLIGRFFHSSAFPNRSNISNIYWDKETTGAKEEFGTSTFNATINNVIGFDNFEMKSVEIYIEKGWDFDNIWDINPDINNGYPFLRSNPDVNPLIFNPPKNLNVEIVNQPEIAILTWDDPNPNNSGTFDHFKVYRNGISIFDYVLDNTFIDNDIRPETNYIYNVTAYYINVEGESRSSNVVNIIIRLEEPPHPVSILSPENEAVEVELKPAFKWELPSEGAAIEGLRFFISSVNNPIHRELMYECCQKNRNCTHFYGGRINPSPAEYTILSPDTIEYTLETELDYETTYYWYVVTFNEFGDSIDYDIFTFTTKEFMSDKNENILPYVTELLGSYPNPFNPNTTIMFTLDKETNVKINVYNVKGQRVKTLLNSFMDKGEHSVLWNGTDDSGLSVSSGVYFYRMVTGDYSQTKRMLLLK